MKVKELIEELQKVDPEYEVTIYNSNEGGTLKVYGFDYYPDLAEFELNAE
jgi:hypothetical protein